MSTHAASGSKKPSEFVLSLRSKFFASPAQGLISLVGLWLFGYALMFILQWGVIDAVWTSPDNTAASCHHIDGACWAVISVRWRLILFGLFPYEEQWRSTIACLAVTVVVVMSCFPYFWTAKRLSLLWIVGFAIFYILMRGGFWGLTSVRPGEWGGLTLTVFVYVAGVLIGMPTAIAFALMRRSKLPVISATMAMIIDGVRSLPLIAILFTAAVILPFALPDWMQGDKIWRVIIGFSLFFAAYQAEIIRSGIQAIPPGQEEAAKALGLSYWQRTGQIVLPQAFRNALPPTINQLVITFKETSLIVIIGFFDIMASGNAAYGSGEWSFAYVEVYVFVALIYYIFVFSLSRYGVFLEHRMRVGLH